MVLAISVVYRGCGIPVAWVVVPAGKKGAWRPHWEELLRSLKGVVPAEWQVIVLADRGLYAPWLFEAIVAVGWHPFLRINVGGMARRQAGGGWGPLTRFAPTPGRCWSGKVVCFKERSLRCTLLAAWTPGYRDAWLVVTTVPPEVAEVAWYGMRHWIEASFKDTKRGGWQWQQTRMRDGWRGRVGSGWRWRWRCSGSSVSGERLMPVCQPAAWRRCPSERWLAVCCGGAVGLAWSAALPAALPSLWGPCSRVNLCLWDSSSQSPGHLTRLTMRLGRSGYE